MMAAVHPPVAPGALGQAIPAAELVAFLDDLRRWRDAQHDELARLDQAALGSADPDAFTADLALAMAVWQAISDRYDRLVEVWDSGRADRAARERLSQLVWGRLDAGRGGAGPSGLGSGSGGVGLGVSLVEALTLSDALADRLRDRLDLDPLAGVGPRIQAVRAAVERCREHVRDRRSGDPAQEPTVIRLRERVDELAARAARGADVAGPLGQLEADVARTERDLIVAAARGRDLDRDRARVADTLAFLETREARVRELAARCTEKIAGPPRLAVPDVSNLGPVPTDRADLDAFAARLDRVAAAMAQAEATFAAPLAERDELRGRLKAYRTMAERTLPAKGLAMEEAWDTAHGLLWSAPCDLAAARDAVGRYQQLVRNGADGEAG